MRPIRFHPRSDERDRKKKGFSFSGRAPINTARLIEINSAALADVSAAKLGTLCGANDGSGMAASTECRAGSAPTFQEYVDLS